VREVAQLLQSQNLGEITLETAGARLTLKRPPYAVPAPAPVLTEQETLDAAELEISAAVEAAKTAAVNIVSPAVGVFRDAKTPLQVGDTVAKKASLGAVETLNIPTELVAPVAGRITEILAIDGQGVEWGQTLLVLEPVETKNP
jgi:acetyl-CoA carboxylase biotin carboxyl carrier protein